MFAADVEVGVAAAVGVASVGHERVTPTLTPRASKSSTIGKVAIAHLQEGDLSFPKHLGRRKSTKIFRDI